MHESLSNELSISLIVSVGPTDGPLDKLMSSLHQQTQPAQQILVMHWGNTDVAAIEGAIVLPVADNLGQALEVAFDKVTGEAFAVVCPNEHYEPQWLAKASALLVEHPQAGLAVIPPSSYALHPVVGRRDAAYHPWSAGFHGGTEVAHALHSRRLCNQQVLMRTELLRACGGFPKGLGGVAHWWARHQLAFLHGLCSTDEVLGYTKQSSWPNAHRSHDPKDLAALLDYLLAEPQQELWPLFARSAALHELGSGLAEVAANHPQYWTTQAQMMLGANFFAYHQHNQRLRLTNFRCQNRGLRADMEPHAEKLAGLCHRKGFTSVALYGAGQHTRILFEHWQQYGGPEVKAIITTSQPEQPTFMGIPLHGIDSWSADVDAVVLSSNSYEREMADTCRKQLPHMPCLAIWDPDQFSWMPESTS